MYTRQIDILMYSSNMANTCNRKSSYTIILI